MVPLQEEGKFSPWFQRKTACTVIELKTGTDQLISSLNKFTFAIATASNAGKGTVYMHNS